MNRRFVAAVGDAADPHAWSGIPFHFWEAAKARGFATEPWRVDLGRVSWQRTVWNLGGVLRGGTGGFQYSRWCLDLLERQIPSAQWQGEIITFNQHFPRAAQVAARGGTLSHYLDAPFAALASGRGLDLRLPRRVVASALAMERENYAASSRVIAMGRWAAEVLVAECAVPARKVHVVLPGANLALPANWDWPVPSGRAGRERPFTLGFIGKDWRRKGLPLLLEVRASLERRGWSVRILAAGEAPADLQTQPGVEFVGFLDKHRDPGGFVRFLAACDVGCLFSEREALGISTLEFLRAGVPVAGFAHEGPADTLPPDAGFRFELGASADAIASRFETFLHDEAAQTRVRAAARAWSPLVTWDRCVAEMQELWTTGTIAHPVKPWLGSPPPSRTTAPSSFS